MIRRRPEFKIKLDFITGLREVVLDEINKFFNFSIIKKEKSSIYLEFIRDFFKLTSLKSVLRACIVAQNPMYHPRYLSNHKSILGDLIAMTIKGRRKEFKSFKILCAGSGSSEVRNIARYVQNTYKLKEKEEADLKIHIFKINKTWEIGAQITSKPLSARKYKIKNMAGSMNPTIAYAVNSLCELEKANSYLNIFSGSGTLSIEAAISCPNLKKIVGFDNQKKAVSLAVQNVKKAGLIERIDLRKEDIFRMPNLGKFDIITSDLPFGMRISKGKSLEKLYQRFVKYCEEALVPDGRIGIYTSEKELFRRVTLKSKLKITKTLELEFLTSVNAYLHPKIFICEFKT